MSKKNGAMDINAKTLAGNAAQANPMPGMPAPVVPDFTAILPSGKRMVRRDVVRDDEDLDQAADQAHTDEHAADAAPQGDVILAQAPAAGAEATAAGASSAGATSGSAVVSGTVAAGAAGASLGLGLAVVAAAVAVAAASSDDSSTDGGGGGGDGGGDDDTTAPEITSGATAETIDENSGAGQVVYTATATDDSEGAVTFSLSGADADLFSIDPDTGEVTLTADPDYETKSSYSFTVVATDAAGNESTQDVTLDIADLDDTNADGDVMAGPIIDDLLITLYAADGSTLGTGTVSALDGSFLVPIPGGYEGPIFAVVRSDGDMNADYRDESTNSDIFLTQPLTAAGYAEGGSITLFVTPLTTLAAKIAGVDAEALLSGDGINLSLTADQIAAASSTVAQLFGLPADFDITNPGTIEPLVDRDGNANSNVNPYGKVLALLSSMGELFGDAGAAIDYFVETIGSVDLDAPAPVTLPAEAVFVMTMAAADGTLSTLLAGAGIADVATDFVAALGVSDDLVAEIDATAIETALSKLTFTNAADVLARVAATANVVSGAAAAALTTAIANVSYPIVFTSSPFAGGFNEGDSSGPGTGVYFAAAVDPGDPTASFTYAIVANDEDDSALFTINDSTGEVSFAQNVDFDYETQRAYTFTVEVVDAADSTRTAQRTVSFSITNLDEVAPTFTSAETADIDENIGSGRIVYRAAADDSGDISAGVTYSLAQDNDDDAERFSINEKTGSVTLNENPNYEVKDSYTFTVIANDGVNDPVSQTVTLTVNDIEPEAPPTVVLFDLVAGEDYTGTLSALSANDEAQTFDADLSYEIYIRMGTAWDTLQGDQINAWAGVSNLGPDDKIYLIQDAGSERGLATYSRFVTDGFGWNNFYYWSNWSETDGGASVRLLAGGTLTAYVSNGVNLSKWQGSDSTGANFNTRWVWSWNQGVRLFDMGDDESLPRDVQYMPALHVDADGADEGVPTFGWKSGQQRPDAPVFALANDTGNDTEALTLVDAFSSDGELIVARIAEGAVLEWRLQVDGEWQDWVTFTADELPVLSEGTYEVGTIQLRQTVGDVTSAAYSNDLRIVVDQTAPAFESDTAEVDAAENVRVIYTAAVEGEPGRVTFELEESDVDDSALLQIDSKTGEVSLRSGARPDADGDKTSYTFTVVAVSDQAGNLADVNNKQTVTVTVTPAAEEAVVLFDLIDGLDATGDSVDTLVASYGGEFQEGVSYTIYVRLPDIDQAFNTTSIQAWTGLSNLDEDDQLFFVVGKGEDGSYVAGDYGSYYDYEYWFTVVNGNGSYLGTQSLDNGQIYRWVSSRTTSNGNWDPSIYRLFGSESDNDYSNMDVLYNGAASLISEDDAPTFTVEIPLPTAITLPVDAVNLESIDVVATFDEVADGFDPTTEGSIDGDGSAFPLNNVPGAEDVGLPSDGVFAAVAGLHPEVTLDYASAYKVTDTGAFDLGVTEGRYASLHLYAFASYVQSDAQAPQFHVELTYDDGSTEESSVFTVGDWWNNQASTEKGTYLLTNGRDQYNAEGVAGNANFSIQGYVAEVDASKRLVSASVVIDKEHGNPNGSFVFMGGVASPDGSDYALPPSTTVLFDLVSGEDYLGAADALVANDATQTFEANRTYDIYIRVGSPLDTLQGDRINAWAGANNLGPDDKIYLVQDAGTERSLNESTQPLGTNSGVFTNNGQVLSYVGWSNWAVHGGASYWLYRDQGVMSAYGYRALVSDADNQTSKSQGNHWAQGTSTSRGSDYIFAWNQGVKLFDLVEGQKLGDVVFQSAISLDNDQQTGFNLAWADGQRRPDAPTFALAQDTAVDGLDLSTADRITSNGQLQAFRVEEGALLEVSTDGGETWTEVDLESPQSLPEGEYAIGQIALRQTVGGVQSAAYFNDVAIVVDTTAPADGFASTTASDNVQENQPVIYTAAVDGDTTGVVYTLKSGLEDDAALLSINPTTGEVRLAAGGNFDYDAGKTSYTFTVLATDRAGNLAEGFSERAVEITLTDDTADNQTIVLFDLTSGKDWIGNTFDGMSEIVEGQTFDAAKTYNIYIRVPAMGNDRSVGEFNAWTGSANLGSDDTIQLIHDDAGLGTRPLQSALDQLFTYKNSSISWVTWSSGSGQHWLRVESDGDLKYRLGNGFGDITYQGLFDAPIDFVKEAADAESMNAVQALPAITADQPVFQQANGEIVGPKDLVVLFDYITGADYVGTSVDQLQAQESAGQFYWNYSYTIYLRMGALVDGARSQDITAWLSAERLGNDDRIIFVQDGAAAGYDNGLNASTMMDGGSSIYGSYFLNWYNAQYATNCAGLNLANGNFMLSMSHPASLSDATSQVPLFNGGLRSSGAVPYSRDATPPVFKLTDGTTIEDLTLSFNAEPTALALTAAFDGDVVPENTDTSNRVKIADIAITDDRHGTNTITLEGSNADDFEVIDRVLYLKTGTTLNYESQQTAFEVIVKVQDNTIEGSTALSTTYNLTVGNVNEPMSALLDTDEIANSVTENGSNNQYSSLTVSATDPDGGNVTYSLVESDGTTPYTGGEFNIGSSNGVVKAISGVDYEAGATRTIYVKATSDGLNGSSVVESFTISVVDDPSDNQTLVLFDLITGEDYYGSAASSMTATGAGDAPTFDVNKTYEIYIRVPSDQGQGNFANMNVWSGWTNLGDDDSVQLIQAFARPGETAILGDLSVRRVWTSTWGTGFSRKAYWSSASSSHFVMLGASSTLNNPVGVDIFHFNAGYNLGRHAIGTTGDISFALDPAVGSGDIRLNPSVTADMADEFRLAGSGELIGPENIVVLFDLTTGKDWVGTPLMEPYVDNIVSDSMVEKSGAGTFDPYKTYDIYIRVGDLTDAFLDADITPWIGGGNLGADDQIHLIQAGATSTNNAYTQLSKSYANSGDRLVWINTDQAPSPYWSASVRLFESGILNANVEWLGGMRAQNTMVWSTAMSTYVPGTVQVKTTPTQGDSARLFTNSSSLRLNNTMTNNDMLPSAPTTAAVFKHWVGGNLETI